MAPSVLEVEYDGITLSTMQKMDMFVIRENEGLISCIS